MNRKLSRRTFIKLSSQATIAAGSGFAVGRLIDKPVNHKFSIYGFLPLDKQLITKVMNVFHDNIGSDSEPFILVNNGNEELLKNILNNREQNYSSNAGSIQYKVEKLKHSVYSDIIVSDNTKSIYSLNNDFSEKMSELRSQLSNIKAQIFFSTEYKQTDIFSSLFGLQKKKIVIENESGVFDKLDFKKFYRKIVVNGPQGKTEILINNGIVKVTKPACRHKLCQNSVLTSNSVNVIACAPNKVLIRTENV